MRIVRTKCLQPLVTVLLCCLLEIAFADNKLSGDSYIGQPLTELVKRYNLAGYSIIYSTALVMPSMTVLEDEKNGAPLVRLRAILKRHRLALQPTAGRGWIIVEWVHEPPASFAVPAPDGKIDPIAPELPLEEIVVTSSRYRLRADKDNSRYRLDTNDLSNFPALGGDVTRAISRIAGTASIGLSARPNIRGGSSDELLVLYDGVELLDPFHLKDFQSIFSTFDPNVINEIDFYTGGFPAQFGNRMSGVMDVAIKPSLTDTRAELGFSLFNTSALLSGKFADEKGQWLVSGRRSNLDLLAAADVINLGTPSYYDVNFLANYQASPTTLISGGVFAFGDNIRTKDGSDSDGEKAQSDYQNLYGWIGVQHKGARVSFAETQLSVGVVDHDREGQIFEPGENVGAMNDVREFRLLRLQQLLEWRPSRNSLLRLGGRISYLKGSYYYHSLVRRSLLAQVVGTKSLIDLNINKETKGSSGNLFLSYRHQYSANLILESGLRWSYQNFSNLGFEQHLSPRLNLRYDLSEQWYMTASAGRFYQPQDIHELQVEDGVEQFQKAQYADQLTLGLTADLGRSYHFKIEAYYKKIGHPKVRFENLFNNLVLIPEIRADRIAVQPDRARAMGLELALSYQSSERWKWWLNYSLSTAEDHDFQGWRPRIWDQRHSVNAGSLLQFEHWNVSANLAWHSGWRTTSLPAKVAVAKLPLNFRRNGAHLRDYFALDFRVSRSWRSQRQDFVVYFQMANTLDRQNVGGMDFALNDDMPGEIGIESDTFRLLPLVPSLGFTWRFR